MALKLNASAVYSLQNLQLRHRNHNCLWSFKPNRLYQNTARTSCSMNMAANQPGDPKKMSITHIVDKARSLWDTSPQPVKTFPWNRTLNHFIQLVLDLVLAVIRILALPVFSITSISEISYCAHERKLYLVPLPFLVGVAAAGVLQNAALESSSYLKYAEVPWHLIALLIFFALLKFPGPYYPYWGRIFIPHMANGAILRTLWFLFLWFRKPQKAAENNHANSVVDNPEADKVL
ncbi:hypothetical protein SASPL_104532 [Salvia splendens]|uniref:Uncharacterized protein n=1 Tax=Salvia splendens TaxID=180675 RepID=A0A8X8YHP5_SALSN|nr:uncharacterized protein LOC121761160 [Salvia splendens]XP_042012704.1 uncharacterized protein LOC121761160 [Salvia splendens]KAG6432938.1 hypothetical protein SASPL_104532 [Salvia splendens]